MAQLQLFVLGPPRLEREGQPIELNLRKALALLVYLAVSGQPQSRDALATMLWPESDQREGRTRLRRTLHRLNETIGDEILDSGPEIIRLNSHADLWLDSAAFRQHVVTATQNLLAPERLARLNAAVEVYSEDFLAGFTLPDSPAFDEWQFFQRESLRQLYGQLLEELVQIYRSQHNWPQAIAYARRWLALDGLHEPAHRMLMRLYAWAGQQVAALRQYQECARILDAELGAAPEDETTALYEAIRTRQLTSPELPDREPGPAPEMLAAEPSKRYVLEEHLAEGGQGEVYRARDQLTGQIVVIKWLKSELADRHLDLIARFVREGAALRRLNHPNIVGLLETFEQAGRYAIVMEYAPGGSLREMLDRASQLPLERVLAIGLELADALSRAHHLGIIHRDVKPENVLLAGDGTPRLSDFGMARLEWEDARLTQSGTLFGSPAYMSPEAVRGEELDARSDIWSLGVVVYELLAGRRPFEGVQITPVLAAIQSDRVPDMREFRADVPPALIALLERMLVKERGQRLSSMRQVAAALEAIRDGRAAEGDLAEPREQEQSFGASASDEVVSPKSGDDSTQAGTGARATGTVGREAELRRLHEHLERALEGTRQMVFVAGEAGIGKTTLVNLFIDIINDSASLWIGRGQCLEHRGVGEAYMPLLEALGRLCRGTDGQELIDLLADHAPSWLVQMPGLIGAEQLTALQQATFQPYREHRLGLISIEQLAALQPKVLGSTRERMLRELVELIDRLTARRPLVLVLEDLHWSDYSTLDVLAMVARRHEGARLLVIGTYRPADVQANNHPLHDIARELHLRGYATAIDLALLTEATVEHYLRTRFGSAAFPDGVARLLHQRTDGNPLFMVTALDAWIGQGLLQEVDGRWMLRGALDELAVGIPETLRQLIELQIGRLDPGDPAILEAASVAGTIFSAVEVAAGVEQDAEAVELRCSVLARHQHFLRERETGEWPDGTIAVQYEFTHHVIQQVLYDRVAATRRARLHRQIGLRLEAGYGPATQTIAAELAIHFVRGRDRPRAVHYLELAAEQALNRSAHREAIELIKLGLDLLQHLPDTPERTQHELALQAMLAPALIATQGWGSLEAERAYLRALDLCTRLGGSRQRDRVLFGLAIMLEYRAEYQQSAELIEKQLRIDRRKGRELVVESYDLLACSMFHQGLFTTALNQAEQGLNLYDPQQRYALIARFGENPGVRCHIWSALSLWFLGYPDQALNRARLAVNKAQEHLYTLAHAQTQLASIHQLRGEVMLAQQYAEMAIAVATEQAFPHRVADGKILQGWAVAVQGQVEDGMRLLHAGLDVCRTMGAMLDYPYFLALIADACSRVGEIDQGLIALAGAQAMVLNSRSFYYEAELHRLKGDLLLQTNRASQIDDAEACFAEALAVARRQGAKSLELRAAVSLGRLWQQQGKQVEAHHLVAETYRWFTEAFDTVDLQQARAFLQEREPEEQAVSQR